MLLGGRYELQDTIGHGNMTTIYRGRDIRMDHVVAIKVWHDTYSTDVRFVARFQEGAKAASYLQHPNIVQTYDYGHTDGSYYLVMELVEGTDLRRYIHSRGVLDVKRSIDIAHDIALGLGAAHRRGIVHRNIKPQSILIGRDESIKLTGFYGVNSLGAIAYYSPEQAQGEIVGPAADVYMLGCIMYQLLTGRPPFDGATPVEIAMQHIQDAPLPPRHFNSNIPPALEAIILRCLEKVPDRRFRDGAELARAIDGLLHVSQ